MTDLLDLQASALAIVEDQISQAVKHAKCHKCGCLQTTVEALSGTAAGQGPLAPVLQQAREVFVPKRYDCIGCAICFPALAANAFVEGYPDEGAGLDLCPTDEPDAREGWPPLPGHYEVIRYGAPVAACTLNSEDLVNVLAARRPEGLAIVGTMHTENLGIERIIKNTLANPEIRYLVLCGEDTQQAIGHLPGQSLASLFENGLDDRGRIVGAKGKRPILKNVTLDEVRAFVDQVQLVPMIGECNLERIAREVERCAANSPGPNPVPFANLLVPRIRVDQPARLVLDKAGYFVVYPERRTGLLIVEHYTNKGVLDCVLEGSSTGSLYSEVIARELISRLDHAAYLGRELARAEASLRTGEPFVQDAAPDADAPDSDMAGASAASCCAPGTACDTPSLQAKACC